MVISSIRNQAINLKLALMYMDNIKNYQEALNPKRKDLYKNIFATYQKMIIG